MRRVGIAMLAIMGLSVWAFAGQSKPRVQLETSRGIILIELDSAKAPKTVANFLNYVKKGHYDGLIFHRVIKKFMIQGGGFTSDMQQRSTDAPIAIEADNGLKNLRGTIAMARTAAPNSATSQFFINTVDNGFLDHKSKTAEGWGYCVFGKVIEGMSVVDGIEAEATTTKGMHADVPVTPVIIKRAMVMAPEATEKQ